MSTQTIIIIIVAIIAVIAFLAARGGGPRVTTIERRIERSNEEEGEEP